MKARNRIALLLAILIVIIPIIIYATKSFPVADDFGNSGFVRDQMVGGSYFLTACKLAVDSYFRIGGYYFAAFMNYFFSPFLRMGITGVRIFNPIVHVVFFASSFLLAASFSRYIIKVDIDMTLVLYFAFIASLVNDRVNSEVYSWYVVMVAYVLPISVMMLADALLIYSFSKKNKLFILSAVLVFLVSGSSLNITALNCGLLLLAVFYCFSVKEYKIESAIVFTAAFIGALISVVAPGNFKRHDSGGSEYYVIGALKSSIVHSLEQIFGLLTRSPMLIFVIIVFALLLLKADYSWAQKLQFKYPVMAVMVAIAGVVIVNYPVYLGAGDTAERCEYVQDIAIYFLTFLLLCYVVGYIKASNPGITISREGLALLTVAVLLYGVTLLNIHGGSDSFATPYMVKSLVTGEFTKYVDYNEGIIKELENSRGKDVVIYNPEFIGNPYMKDMNIRPNDQAYTNHTMTRYYGLKSLRLYEE